MGMTCMKTRRVYISRTINYIHYQENTGVAGSMAAGWLAGGHHNTAYTSVTSPFHISTNILIYITEKNNTGTIVAT